MYSSICSDDRCDVACAQVNSTAQLGHFPHCVLYCVSFTATEAHHSVTRALKADV